MKLFNTFRAMDLAFVGLALLFIWACFLLAVHKFGPHGPNGERIDAFHTFLTDHGCVPSRQVPRNGTERGYTEYKCEYGGSMILYDMQKGLREEQ